MNKFTQEQIIKILAGVRCADEVYGGDKYFYISVEQNTVSYLNNLDNVTENGKRGWYSLDGLTED